MGKPESVRTYSRFDVGEPTLNDVYVRSDEAACDAGHDECEYNLNVFEKVFIERPSPLEVVFQGASIANILLPMVGPVDLGPVLVSRSTLW